MRRLAGDDPQVNEEWNCDKGRFGFGWTRQPDRLTTPLVRDEQTRQLRPASWIEAFVVAARGLAKARGRTGVLTGGRLTAEDAYAYAKFARVALHSNDVDFRARAASAEEADFLASHVVATQGVTYADLESASVVLLVGFEPEDESPIIFLRLRKAMRKHSTRVVSVASHTSRGLAKLGGRLVRTPPGGEAQALAALAGDADLALDGGGVILVGERLAAVPGGLSAALRLAASTGARLAWVPRRAGERGALEAGCLPALLPGGRPVSDPSARADAAAAWGVTDLPATPGRDTAAILAAGARGELAALVVAGVDPIDLPDTATALAALDTTPFVVSLEVRASAVSERADVVLPVAAAAEKAGMFVDWEGRVRPFPVVLPETGSLPDLRVLAGIAEEMGSPLGFRTVEQARADMVDLGAWDGPRAPAPDVPAGSPVQAAPGSAVLDTWRQLIDDGRMLDGDPYLHATARRVVARLSPGTVSTLGLLDGDEVLLRTSAGALALPYEVADLPDSVVWAPQSSGGAPLSQVLGAGAGSVVSVEARRAPRGATGATATTSTAMTSTATSTATTAQGGAR
jgi:NADH-quinone oxidoreductase subunit G